MLFLSPMSNTQHFITLALPAFCLAHLAVVHRRWPPALLVLAAIAARSTVVKWLWGEQFSDLCMWWGNVTWSEFFLLLGCAWVLLGRHRADAAGGLEQARPLPAARAA